MQNCKLHIVALPYCEVGECLGEFMAEAEGRAMTVRPDEGNEYDAMAIRAYDWQGRHVGYVAAHDLLEAWQMLRGSGRRSLHCENEPRNPGPPRPLPARISRHSGHAALAPS